jgi:Uma2 family endonuclease
MEAIRAQHISQKPKKIVVPSYLIYEVLDGEPIYFRGYQDVLNHKKTKEDIMATGRLQTLIISTLQEHLWANHNREGLKYMSNEVGIHISTNVNLSCDLVAFDKTVLAATEDDTHYYTIPPKFVIEVDTNGDFSNKIFEDYLFKKSKRLLTFGADQVIWILTASKTVTVSMPDGTFITQGWDRPIEIFDGHPLVLEDLFKENGIKIA